MNGPEKSRSVRQGLAAEIVLILAVTIVAAGLRFSAVSELPPGLYRDEAYNGLDALRVLQGERPLFFEANNGREPLFIYLLALGVRSWGRTPGALRSVSALIGTLTIPCLYWLARELYDRRAAFVAAVMATCSVWMLNTSRIVLRTGTMVPILALALAALIRGTRLRRFGWMVLSGVLFGIGVYTYLPARLAAVALAIYLALDWKRQGRLWVRGWLPLAGCAIVVAAPLLVYLLGSENAGRIDQVSILNPEMRQGTLVQALVSQAWATLAGLFWRGDFIPRHNIPLRPFLPIPYAVAMAFGLWCGLRDKALRTNTFIVLVWLVLMLVPTWLAEGAPHMLRAAGILPVLYLLPALGLVSAAQWLYKSGHAGTLGIAGLLLMVLAISADNVLDYHDHLRSESVYYNYESGATELASALNQWLDETELGRAHVAQRLWDGFPSLRFLCADTTGLATIRQKKVPSISDAHGDVLLALWPFETLQPAMSALPSGRLIAIREGAYERQDLAIESRLLYLLVTATDPMAAPDQPQAVWEQGVALRGVEVTPAQDDSVDLALYWQVREPVGADYTVFCHILRDGRMIGQHDGSPVHGYYGTSQWRPGDMVCDVHHIALSDDLDGDCQIVVGLYAWPSLDHLRLVDAAGRMTDQESYSWQMTFE